MRLVRLRKRGMAGKYERGGAEGEKEDKRKKSEA